MKRIGVYIVALAASTSIHAGELDDVFACVKAAQNLANVTLDPSEVDYKSRFFGRCTATWPNAHCEVDFGVVYNLTVDSKRIIFDQFPGIESYDLNTRLVADTDRAIKELNARIATLRQRQQQASEKLRQPNSDHSSIESYVHEGIEISLAGRNPVIEAPTDSKGKSVESGTKTEKPSTPPTTSIPRNPASQPLKPGTTRTCESGTVRSGQKRRVNGSEHILHADADAGSPKLVNQKATRGLGKTHYLSISSSVTVMEECTLNGWSRVRVIEPNWLADSHIGWVPTSALRSEERDSSGYIIFSEKDFDFDADTRPYRDIIIAGVNKAHREDQRCKKIDTGTADISQSRGSPADPVFYVTCGEGVNVVNVFFSKSEIEKDKTLRAPQHVSRSSAIDACEQYAKQSATHPSTVKFSRIMDLAVTEHPNGRTTVISSFTAKNSFNLEEKFEIHCLMDATGLFEAEITQAQ